MGRHKKQLTQEQIDFRNGILRSRVKPIKKTDNPATVLSNEDKIRQSFFYLNNCIYWINEYIDGRIGKDRLLETARAIQGNAKKLEETILKLKP